jgi:hypothetical protein
MRKKRVPNGEPRQFLEAVATMTRDDCLPWPYARYPNGYGAVVVDGRMTTANRAVCKMRYGPAPTPEHEAAHTCGNRACVNPSHLRWATPLENHDDQKRAGTAIRGQRQGSAKITEELVRDLRARNSSASLRVLAAEYGISKSQVSRIVRGQSWAWAE